MQPLESSNVGTVKREEGPEMRRLLERLPAAAYATDAEGLITFFNERAAKLWGRTPALRDPIDRFCGCLRLYAPDGTPLTHDACWMALALRNNESYDGRDITIERPDGTRRMVLSHATPIHDAAGEVAGAVNVLVDITDHRVAEEAARRQSERMQLLWESAAVLLTANDPTAMLRELFATIGPHMGLDTYFNCVLNEARDGLRVDSCIGISEEEAGRIVALFPARTSGDPIGRRRRPTVVTDIKRSAQPDAAALEAAGLNAYACYPLVSAAGLLGTVSFGSRSRSSFDSEELSFLEAICQYASVANERLRLLGELREADARKDEFLATLAHELRNPLAPVRNAAHVLRMKAPDDPELRWGRDVIERQVEHLTRLVDDLLDISRIARGRLELRKERVELREVIRSAVEMSRPLIEQRAHELTVHLPEKPVYLQADSVRLAQVFMNLLNNAAKYTERGGDIRLTAEVADGSLVVRVRDTGAGIAADALPRIFELFYRADSSLERSHPGLGIGLSLVGRLVEAHGGSVVARSEGPGKGSEFAVTLPTVEEPEERRTDGQAGRKDGVRIDATASRRVLVADDVKDAADSLAMLLELRGYEVRTAHDGHEAVEVAEEFRPHVALLDIGMPKLNGYDACRRIRERPWGQRMVLIALTGWGQPEDRRRTEEAGFDAHIVKPVEIKVLLEVLASHSEIVPDEVANLV